MDTTKPIIAKRTMGTWNGTSDCVRRASSTPSSTRSMESAVRCMWMTLPWTLATMCSVSVVWRRTLSASTSASPRTALCRGLSLWPTHSIASTIDSTSRRTSISWRSLSPLGSWLTASVRSTESPERCATVCLLSGFRIHLRERYHLPRVLPPHQQGGGVHD